MNRGGFVTRPQSFPIACDRPCCGHSIRLSGKVTVTITAIDPVTLAKALRPERLLRFRAG